MAIYLAFPLCVSIHFHEIQVHSSATSGGGWKASGVGGGRGPSLGTGRGTAHTTTGWNGTFIIFVYVSTCLFHKKTHTHVSVLWRFYLWFDNRSELRTKFGRTKSWSGEEIRKKISTARETLCISTSTTACLACAAAHLGIKVYFKSLESSTTKLRWCSLWYT